MWNYEQQQEEKPTEEKLQVLDRTWGGVVEEDNMPQSIWPTSIENGRIKGIHQAAGQ